MFQRLISCIALFGLAAIAQADNHTKAWRGVNLDQQFGIQFEVCQLNPGKTLDDMAKLNGEVRRLFAETGLALSLMRLTPMYSHSMPGEPATSYIDVTMGTIEAFGTGWDNWLASKDALKLMAASNKVATCTFKFARAINRVAQIEALDSTDDRLISMNWCSKRDNVSWDQLKTKHDAWQAAYENDSSSMAWNVVLPRLGAGNAQGRFMHMVSYANAQKLMANENWVANGGGSRALGDYYSAYAACDGESVWNASYLYKNEG